GCSFLTEWINGIIANQLTVSNSIFGNYTGLLEDDGWFDRFPNVTNASTSNGFICINNFLGKLSPIPSPYYITQLSIQNSSFTNNKVGMNSSMYFYNTPVAPQSALIYAIKATFNATNCTYTGNQVPSGIFAVFAGNYYFGGCNFSNNFVPPGAINVSSSV